VEAAKQRSPEQRLRDIESQRIKRDQSMERTLTAAKKLSEEKRIRILETEK
jgi:hypothetical protein